MTFSLFVEDSYGPPFIKNSSEENPRRDCFQQN